MSFLQCLPLNLLTLMAGGCPAFCLQHFYTRRILRTTESSASIIPISPSVTALHSLILHVPSIVAVTSRSTNIRNLKGKGGGVRVHKAGEGEAAVLLREGC